MNSSVFKVVRYRREARRLALCLSLSHPLPSWIVIQSPTYIGGKAHYINNVPTLETSEIASSGIGPLGLV